MGFLRRKKVKGKGYFYYCERRRSGKKDGGSGAVRSVDKFIGGYTLGGYLPFWLWDGLSVEDYASALIAYEWKDYEYLIEGISWEIHWTRRRGRAVAGKLVFRSVPGSGADARQKWPRWLRLRWQADLEAIFQQAGAVEDAIDGAAADLARYERAKKGIASTENAYQNWRKNPDREWWEGEKRYRYSDSYGDDCLATLESLREWADYWFLSYQKGLEELAQQAPPSERERFRAAVVQKCEKLAADPYFLDRYSVTK